ncbi:hypothetical protein DY000_02031345 [Brassica cretica]|uniref:Uncharacterized protein n=1 Tax=Brassica cretica TaxID=69181 RepID=A0ABQ7DXY6_BRACR|nr:hypothetical protein DY000_02031345 [Brassica cretica]
MKRTCNFLQFATVCMSLYPTVELFEGLEKEEGHLKTTHHNNIVQLLYSFQEKSIDSLLARSRRLREILHRL